MSRVVAERSPIDVKQLKMTAAKREHFDRVIDANAQVYIGDELAVVYQRLEGDYGDLERALCTIDYHKAPRTGGLPSESRIFGYRPRIALRMDYCSVASLATDWPAEHKIVEQYAVHVSEIYAKHGAQKHAAQKAMLEKVLPEWRIPQSVYTSGIINKNNVLRYHHDAGNFKGCWSGMIVLPNRAQGGELVMPELRLAFAFTKPSVLLFDGQAILHGVMPIQCPRMGYRYSIVYYALQTMCKCLPFDQELARIRTVKSEREVRRLEYKAGGAVSPKTKVKK
jgi:hypothetical protein